MQIHLTELPFQLPLMVRARGTVLVFIQAGQCATLGFFGIMRMGIFP